MSHTPGPWIANKYRVFAETSLRIIAYARGLNNSERTLEDVANALLIAAAPELLDELKKIRQVINNSEAWWMDCPDKGGFDTDAINALIDKAEGRS